MFSLSILLPWHFRIFLHVLCTYKYHYCAVLRPLQITWFLFSRPVCGFKCIGVADFHYFINTLPVFVAYMRRVPCGRARTIVQTHPLQLAAN